MNLTYQHLGHCGRIGNQFWQVASTVGIARTLGVGVQLDPEWEYRPFLSCPDEWFGSEDIGKSAEQVVPFLHENARNYLQDYGLWKDVDEVIHDAFSLSPGSQLVVDEEWKKIRYSDTTCGVHVRRGDYVGHPDLPAQEIDYYERAVDSLKPDRVIVFSDDPEWCEQNLPFADTVYRGVVRPLNDGSVEEYRKVPPLDWIDIYLMAKCDSHVISNSSYSWWAAWYARDAETRYPSMWTNFDWFEWRRMILPGWVEIGV